VNQAGTFTFGAVDPADADNAAGFDYVINWGDGSANTTVHAGGSTSRNHTYTKVGPFTISYIATDKDGGASAPVTKLVTVGGAQVTTDPSDPTKTALIVGGTTGNDNILIDKGAGSSSLQVKLNGTVQGTFSFTGSYFVFGQEGNDTITVSRQLNRDAFLYGGDGNDTISSGNGRSVAVGGAGNDAISAGNGCDVLLGGFGADTMSDGNGDDILVAGPTSYDTFSKTNATALRQLRDEWSRTDLTYATRVNRLLGVTPGSPFVFHSSGGNQNVFSDTGIDKLSGGNDNDWFIGNFVGGGVLDQLADRRGAETATDL
jgi:Ca2+-binding RTX toxin-like protein